MTTMHQKTTMRKENGKKLIPARKARLAKKLSSLLDEYSTCLVIDITNIGSKQIAELRKEMRGKARFLFGKNTLMRKVIRDYVKQYRNGELMQLMELIKGNCGLVFTKEKPSMIRKELIKNKQESSAKIGSTAPNNVFLPIGPTNLEPTKTPILQIMDIETRINRGQIDIISEKHLIKKGEKINASQAFVLSELNIKPFYYGITVRSVYDNGKVIEDCSFMDMSATDIRQSFYNGVRQMSALCFSLSYPTIMNVPHSLISAYKRTLGLGLMLETYSFDGLECVKQALEDAVHNMQVCEEDLGSDKPKGKGVEFGHTSIFTDTDTDTDTESSDNPNIFEEDSDSSSGTESSSESE